MGHSFVPADSGTLYGHKTDIKSQLSDGDAPAWLLTWTDNLKRRTKRMSNSELEERLEEAASEARQSRKRIKESDVLTYESGTASGLIELPINTSRLPSKVRERLSVTTEKAQDYTGFHHINPRDYRVHIQVGTRGGVKEVTLGRDFHH